MDTLDAINAFLRVAELGSFTEAAQSLGRPKSAVSQAVSRLESRLNTQLLYRTTRRVQLTHDGQSYYDRARDLVSDLDDMNTMFQSSPRALSGTLRVDLPVALAQRLVVPNLPNFLATHPAVNIELSSTDRRVDVVAEGFDCVLRVGLLSDSSLVARHVGDMTMVNLASPDYLARFGVPQTLDDLAHHHMVHYVSAIGAKPYGFEYRDGDTYRTVEVGGRVVVNNTIAFQSAVRAGLGIVQSPLIGAREDLAAGVLVEILPRYQAEPLPVSLIYPRRRHQARRVRAFMDWLAALVAADLV